MLFNIQEEKKLGTSVCFFYLSSALHTTGSFLFLKILCPISLDLHDAHTIHAFLVFHCLYSQSLLTLLPQTLRGWQPGAQVCFLHISFFTP